MCIFVPTTKNTILQMSEKRKEIESEEIALSKKQNQKGEFDTLEEFVEYIPNFLDTKIDWFKEIVKNVEFTQETITVFGKSYLEPRLTAVFADKDKCETKNYGYSGSQKKLLPMIPILSEIRDQLEKTIHIRFDFVLINFYRNGDDKVGWHSDKEKGQNCDHIASVSIGGSRKFQLKNMETKVLYERVLDNGSLLLMKPGCQETFKHAIPPTKKACKPRINLTFRRFE